MISQKRQADLESLLERIGIDVSKKRRKNLLEIDEVAYESYKAGVEVAFCCKTVDIDGAYTVFSRCKEQNIPLSPNLYTNLLSLTAGLGEPGSGCSRKGTAPQDYAKALEIYDRMKELSIVPAEAAFSALIRCCCQQGHRAHGKQLYDDMKGAKIVPKLRTVSSLLSSFGAAGDAVTCFAIFDELAQFEIIPTEKEYCSLLRACFLGGDARFLNVLEQLMEDMLILHNEETMHLLEQYFASPYAPTTFVKEESPVDMHGYLTGVDSSLSIQLKSVGLTSQTQEGLLQQLHSFAVNRDPQQKHKINNKVRDMVAGKTDIEAMCADNNLTVNDVSKAIDSVAESGSRSVPEAVATDADADRSAKLFIPKSSEDKWLAYTAWLEKRRGDYEFDIIVDGANVGYYKQNFAGAPNHVDYHQINALLNGLINQHQRKPLLIIHSRHLADSMIPPHDPVVREIIASWKSREILYATPKGFNDDWFWMYATVKYTIPVVTNDDMRDHHFQLLSPRYFIRWRERSRVCYDLFFSKKIFSESRNATLLEDIESDDDDISSVEDINDKAVADTVSSASAAAPIGDESCSGTFVFRTNYKPRFPPNCHRSRAKFYFPTEYSHRMQHLVTDTYDAFVFPPLVPKLHQDEIVTAEIASTEEAKVVPAASVVREDPLLGRAASSRQDITGANNSSGKWICIYSRR